PCDPLSQHGALQETVAYSLALARCNALCNAKFQLPQALDLIPQPGRFLELEIAGALEHLRLELLHLLRQGLRLQVRGGRSLAALAVAPLPAPERRRRARARALHDVGDRFVNAARGDRVRGVVFELLVAPPVGLLDCTLHGARHPVRVEDRAAI